MRASTLLRPARDQRGAAMPLVALCLVVILSTAALAVDFGMLVTARAAAQRSADAAALAGASTYMDALPSEDSAVARARDYATRNQILSQKVRNDEVSVWVNHDSTTVTVRVGRDNVPLFFAKVFGQTFADVAASASARVTVSGTAACIKPFALPDATYGDDDIGTRVLLWESRSNNPADTSASEFLLVGNPESPKGVGHDIYHMLVDTSCDYPQVQVGGEIPAQPSNNARGNVMSGLDDIEDEHGELTWSPDGPYDGFNRADWASDPRVAIIPTYEESSYAPPGTDNVVITGFIRVVIDSELVTCRNGSAKPCHYAGTGNRVQLYATVLPSTGIPDTCVGTGCAQVNRVLRLIH